MNALRTAEGSEWTIFACSEINSWKIHSSMWGFAGAKMIRRCLTSQLPGVRHKQTYRVNQIDLFNDGAYNWDITAVRGSWNNISSSLPNPQSNAENRFIPLEDWKSLCFWLFLKLKCLFFVSFIPLFPRLCLFLRNGSFSDDEISLRFE